MSPEVKGQGILQLVMMHRSLGFQMYRSPDVINFDDHVNGIADMALVGLAGRLCVALGVTQALANQIIQGIPFAKPLTDSLSDQVGQVGTSKKVSTPDE